MRPRLPAVRRGAAMASVAMVILSVVALGMKPAPAWAVTLLANDDSATVVHDHTLAKAAPGVLANDTGLLGGTVLRVSGPGHGALTLRSDGSYTYVPNAGYVGTDSFSYKVRSLLLVTSNTAQVTISVTNAAPIATSDAYTWSGGTLVVPARGVLINDSDADGDSLTAEFDGGGLSGSFDGNPDGSFSFNPGGGFPGTGTATYRVSDGIVWSQAVTITLRISATPTPTPTPRPTAVPTARPTPTPTPVPLPSVPLPSVPLPSIPLPSLPALPGPSGASPSASSSAAPTAIASSPVAPASPGPSQPPSPGATGGAPSATPGAGGVSRSPGSSGDGPDGASGQAGAGFRVPARADGGFGLSLGDLGLTAGFETWVVPAATVSGAGLLVLLFVLAQAGATVVWVPAVRRLRGERQPRRRRRH